MTKMAKIDTLSSYRKDEYQVSRPIVQLRTAIIF